MTYKNPAVVASDPDEGEPRQPFRILAVLVGLGLLILTASGLYVPTFAEASRHSGKAIWGPTTPDSFDRYSDLDIGIYQISLSWGSAAPVRPESPRNPSDPAYRWSDQIDYAVDLARERGIEVAVNLTFSPKWANGGKPRRWAPLRASDFGDFAAAAARRYPYVKYWMIWSEPSRRGNFMPLARVRGPRQLSLPEMRGPKIYSKILQASFESIKTVDRKDLVVGGGTIPGGDIRPLRFIQALRLPNGAPPQMDLYGHNTYSPRLPKLFRPPAAFGTADLSNLNDLVSWIDRYLGRGGRNRALRVYSSEYSLPTNRNDVLPFWGNLQDQARYARAALKVKRKFKRLATLGWFQLYDEAPQPNGLQADWGLLTWQGTRKPAYSAFKAG